MVLYEELAENPAGVIEKICGVLRFDYRSEMVNQGLVGWNDNSSYSDAGTNIFTSSIERWRTELTPEETAAADFLCGPEMTLTRYSPASDASPAAAFNFMSAADSHEYSWRSDSGDTLPEFGGELVRAELIRSAIRPKCDVVRRCFLFEEVLEQIRDAAGHR